ncbi:hypothetical protein IAQ61_006360, partial [Plenodomus lingam]|uniref:uncharacterized protein n=1 Tax=Leptosphaeria maculans TaxID=5022 RepID=UPI00331A2AAD
MESQDRYALPPETRGSECKVAMNRYKYSMRRLDRRNLTTCGHHTASPLPPPLRNITASATTAADQLGVGGIWCARCRTRSLQAQDIPKSAVKDKLHHPEWEAGGEVVGLGSKASEHNHLGRNSGEQPGWCWTDGANVSAARPPQMAPELENPELPLMSQLDCAGEEEDWQRQLWGRTALSLPRDEYNTVATDQCNSPSARPITRYQTSSPDSNSPPPVQFQWVMRKPPVSTSQPVVCNRHRCCVSCAADWMAGGRLDAQAVARIASVPHCLTEA